MPERSANAEPAEAFAMGTLHGILKEAKVEIEYPFDVNSRQFDVTGLVPATEPGKGLPVIRITIEEVQ